MRFCAGEGRLISRLARVRGCDVSSIIPQPDPVIRAYARRLGAVPREFSASERETLRHCWPRLSIMGVASATGRTPEECMAEAQRLHLPLGDPEKDRAPAMDTTTKAYVQRCAAAGLTAAEISLNLGRNVHSAFKNGKRRMLKPWTPEDDAQLEHLIGKGLSRSKVGHKLGRTKNSVIKRCHKLGVGL